MPVRYGIIGCGAIAQRRHIPECVANPDSKLAALADADLARFGPALSEIQSITGRWFAPAQGGTFTPGPTEELVRRLTEWGAAGVGQSSWGPTVYGIVEGEEAGGRLAERVREALGSSGTVYEGPFRTDGARVWHAAVPVTAR